MAKRPRRAYSLESRLRRIIASDPILAGSGSSAEEVASAIRSRRREFRRYGLEVFTSAVRRALSSLPPADSGRSSHDSTTTSSSSSSCTHSPPPPRDTPVTEDVTKSLLRSHYSSQTSKRRLPEGLATGAHHQQEVQSEATMDTEEAGAGGRTHGGGGKGPMFADLGGMEAVTNQLTLDVVFPLRRPEVLRWLGVRPITGILLHGPPGCGKTTLAHAIANESGVPFYKTSATDFVNEVSGASEENIRTLFNKAYRTAPSIVFIDEIDAIASKREDAQRGMERRIVTQLMTCMDELHQNIPGSDDGTASATASDMDTSQPSAQLKPAERYVIVIGATNRPDTLDQALRRPGRFDQEIFLDVPDENARRQILERLTRSIRLPPEGGGQFDLGRIVRATPGFVGADLKALVYKAGNLAVGGIANARMNNGNKKQDWMEDPLDEREMESLCITMDDFEKATKEVQPSLRREGFSSVPDIKWAHVGGLDSLREELHCSIVRCIKYPEYYEKFGVDMQAGFLLFGPPGCGKTLIAKAVAHEAGANFIHIKGPELLSKFVGVSESDVRKAFSRARINSPCIIFFDEIDALTTKRGNEGAWVVERVVNTLLSELDGAGQRQGVFVIGATNRIDVVDDALLRPGRFGKKHFVPLPDANERASILKSLALQKTVSSSVNLDAFARREECSNFSGADLASLMSEAAMAALDERLKSYESLESCENLSGMNTSIETSHFERALSKVKPSVSEQQRKYHDALKKKYSSN